MDMRRKLALKLFALIAIPLALAATPSMAGDYAERALLGFSPDGHYCAFEEYGVQDGSGFPYSNIFLIDTATDDWVAGTPIRVLIEGDSPLLSETRSESTDRFRPFLMKYWIGAQGLTVAKNPLTETSANRHFVSFLPRLLVPLQDRDYELVIHESALPAPDCPDVEQGYRGFQLALRDHDGSSGSSHVTNGFRTAAIVPSATRFRKSSSITRRPGRRSSPS